MTYEQLIEQGKYELLKNESQAIAAFINAVKLAPLNPAGYYWLALGYLAARDYHAMLECFEIAALCLGQISPIFLVPMVKELKRDLPLVKEKTQQILMHLGPEAQKKTLSTLLALKDKKAIASLLLQALIKATPLGIIFSQDPAAYGITMATLSGLLQRDYIPEVNEAMTLDSFIFFITNFMAQSETQDMKELRSETDFLNKLNFFGFSRKLNLVAYTHRT